ncbi:hypothetical protein KJ365_12840 [Glaciecola sp. XM2]|jgi:hypothetical protein|uniref:hypothetical protein n=1 Tax=Glaciecola sp. XM2 TaxID=1914931 RepID=UPI001BDE25CC|nr:hypothetical protein [Glaciecola sp. XM2]MBT1451771.1 hypothetical protein [Glaciecola sp. XM2]
MSKITTRQVTHLNDILNDNVIRCAALIKGLSPPMHINAVGHPHKTHEFSHEFYISVELETLNVGGVATQQCSVEAIIDTDSELEIRGLFNSLNKAMRDEVYVIFEAVYLAVDGNQVLLQGARAEITNLKQDAYFKLISAGTPGI